MLRLTGLPSPAGFPRASVTRLEDRIEIRFSGPESATHLDVPLGYLGPDDDHESVELRLLDQLKRLGYEVRRERPT